MKLLMISGDRAVIQGRKGAFWYTLQEFQKHWDRIDVICPRVPTVQVTSINDKVFFHPCSKGLWYQKWWVYTKGKELVQEHKHRVMTVHDYPPFYNGIGASMLARATGIPYALEVHHIVGWPRAASLSEWIGRLLARVYFPLAGRSATAIRVVNQATRDLLIRWRVPEKKIHIVPSFYLDRDLLAPAQNVAKEYDLVFCARLMKNKGLMPLLKAVRALPDLRLLVIGDGPERCGAMQYVSENSMEKRVTFTGWLPENTDVVAALHTAKIFVMNSTSEGGPRSALEAMACGLPVLSTRVGIMEEVLHDGENGIFTDGSPDALQAAVTRLLGDPTMLQQMGERACHVLDRFERNALITEYSDFLKSLA